MTDSKWNSYFSKVKPQLAARAHGFESIFRYLKKRKNPVIIETGTYREENNYSGDGCSTLLFDNFIELHCGGKGQLMSVDIDPNACTLAQENTNHADVFCSDSIEFLGTLYGKADLLYLDSYNITDWGNDWEASSHHLKELFAAKNVINPGTLIVVDDNIIFNNKRMGKGRLIYELMDALGVEPFIDEYQVGWIWPEE
jgi:hypothetical protein